MNFKREPLTQDEAKRLNDACETQREKLVVWTLLDSGLRIEELISLEPHNIDWQAHQLIIWGKGRSGKKKRRIVPMTDRTRALLEGYFANSTNIGFGKRAAQYLVQRVANRARISRPCSPHVLRHTFAVTCLKKGMALTTLKDILGHSSLSTSFLYLNMQPEFALKDFRDKW